MGHTIRIGAHDEDDCYESQGCFKRTITRVWYHEDWESLGSIDNNDIMMAQYVNRSISFDEESPDWEYLESISTNDEWQIQDFPDDGAPTVPNFPQKLHENEKNWTQGERPWRFLGSTNDDVNRSTS